MNYYKAREQDEIPKLVFDLVATSEEELEALGLDADPLVVTEDQLINDTDPNYISFDFGICHLRIHNGELEPRPGGEIDAAEDALEAVGNSISARLVGDELDSETFVYDDHTFPLHAAARTIYQAIIAKATGNYYLYAMEGKYALLTANISAFAAAMNDKIIAIQIANTGPVSE